MSSYAANRRNFYAPKRTNERHYCSVCNVWMDSLASSIRLHENGKKHQDNVKKQSTDKVKAAQQEEKQRKRLQAALKVMETGAAESSARQDAGYYEYTTIAPPVTTSIPSVASVVPSSQPESTGRTAVQSNKNKKKELKEWENRKRQRRIEEAAAEKRRKSNEDKLSSDDKEDDGPLVHRQNSTTTEQGFYTVTKNVIADATFAKQEIDKALSKISIQLGVKPKATQKQPDKAISSWKNTLPSNPITVTYLEGSVFGNMLEPDFPIELWVGPADSTPAERRLPQHDCHWTTGLVTRIQRKAGTVSVAFLSSPEAEEESIENDVPVSRIRIAVGRDHSGFQPETIDEARILAGIDVATVGSSVEEQKAAIDDATGLASWTTVEVKRTTARKEQQEERAREREARRQKARQEEVEVKRAEERRREEAAVTNAADDSALGALWNSKGTGYRGIDLQLGDGHQQGDSIVIESKALADGRSVGFSKKKANAFKAKKKQNVRRTSADDDD